MYNPTRRACSPMLLCLALAACTSGQSPLGATASAQTPQERQPKQQDDVAMQASLSATGNAYPAPALFVKRWNLLAQAVPQAQITKFTSRGYENDPRPIADLDGFDFSRAERTYLQIGSSGLSVDYVTIRDDPTNIGATERPNLYSITFNGNQKKLFAELCIWVIRSTKSSFSMESATQLLKDAVDYVPPSHATDPRKHAEGEGVSVGIWTGGNATCEVKEVGRK